MTLRRMTVRPTPFETYKSAVEALRGASEANSRLRTVADDQIRGKVIRRMSWDDAALTFELDDGQYLNISARAQSVGCSLTDTPMVVTTSSFDDVILLDFGGDAFEWRRAELSHRVIEKPLMKLWFSDPVMLFVYVKGLLLLCAHIVDCDGERPALYWGESD